MRSFKKEGTFNAHAFILRLKHAEDVVALELTKPNLFAKD